MRTKTITLDPENLPDDLKLLKTLIIDLISELKNKQSDIDLLREHLMKALRHRFGRHSETIALNQMALFEQLIAEQLADVPAMEKPEAREEKVPVKGHGRRKPSKELPKKTEVFPLAEEKKCCPECQGAMKKIGDETRTELEWVPASVYVHEMVAEKYACPKCQDGVVTSELPTAPIVRGMAGPGLLAHVITSKYADFLPLHRQVRIFQRHGLDVNDSTLNDWVGQSAHLFEPLMTLWKTELLKSKVIHSDETPVAVLEPRPKKGEGRREGVVDPVTGQPTERKAARQGRLWVYVGDPRNPYTVFDYSPDRKGEWPRSFLEGWKGHLQADGYGGLDRLYTSGDILEVGCWSHARRKFKDAITTDKVRSQSALAFIRKLYDVEMLTHDVDETIRREMRQKHAKPVLVKFREWLDAQSMVVLPKSLMADAIGYARNQWGALIRYPDNGALNIDNNTAERALRRVALGRKNWMTLGTDEGGRWAATFFSIVATCERLDIDPFVYLRDVLSRLRIHPVDRLHELLPPHWKAAKEAPAQPTPLPIPQTLAA